MSKPELRLTNTLIIALPLLTLKLIILTFYFLSPQISDETGQVNFYPGTYSFQLFVEIIILLVLLRRRSPKNHKVVNGMQQQRDLLYIIPASVALIFLIFPLEQIIAPTTMTIPLFPHISLWANIIFAIFLSILEEIIFQRFLTDHLLTRFSPFKSILLSAILFCLTMRHPAQLPGLFLTGCFCGFIYWQTRSVVFCITGHFIISLVRLLAGWVFSNSSLFNSISNNTPAFLVIDLLSAVLFVVCMIQLYRKHLDCKLGAEL